VPKTGKVSGLLFCAFLQQENRYTALPNVRNNGKLKI
jgi:hypothetical protein